jgi:hypothetical protein
MLLRRLRRTLAVATPVLLLFAGTAPAQPRLALGEFCPVTAGQQLYGVEASLTGVPAGAVFDLSYDFGGVSGDVTSVQADENGNLGPLRVSFNQPVKFIAVNLSPLSPRDSTARLYATLKEPCKHATKRGAPG